MNYVKVINPHVKIGPDGTEVEVKRRGVRKIANEIIEEDTAPTLRN